MDYRAQIESVLHYINEQIRRNWSYEADNAFNEVMLIEKLAKKACLSERNFQIYFKIFTGETVGQYINRLRIEYAMQLLKENRYSQKEIAERTGWANDTAFYNAFKKRHNLPPAKYKKERLCVDFEADFEEVAYRIEELKDTPIVFFMYSGGYDGFVSDYFEEESWDILYEFAKANDLLPEKEECWGVCYDDQDITKDENCRFYAGVSVKNMPKLKITDRIKSNILPQGKYAVYTHKGSYAELDSFYNAILRQLPEGYILGEGLILERYLNGATDTSENDLLTEVLLPVIRN